MREPTLGTLLVVGAAAGFGTIGIFGEVAATIDLSLSTLLPVRFVLATAIVAVFALARGWAIPRSGRAWLATLGLGVVYTLMTVSFFVSLRYLTAGIATIVLYTYPTVVVVLSAVFLGEAVTRRKLVALALATGGVGLVVGTGTAGVGGVGVALALGAAGSYGVYTTGSRLLSPSLAPRALMLGILVGAAASMVGYGVLADGIGLPSGREEWAVVLGLTVVSTVVPHLLFYEGVARLEASRVGVVSTVEPVVTVALGALLLNEPVTVFVLAGGGMVLAAVVWIQGRSDEPVAMPEAPAAPERGDSGGS